MHAGHIKRVTLWLGMGVLGWAVWPSGAEGQGVPVWAPRVSDTVGGPDGGTDGGFVRAIPIFREPDAGPRRSFYKDTVEFFLGFDPLEPSPEELARKAAKEGRMLDAGASAAVEADAGMAPVASPDAGSAGPG